MAWLLEEEVLDPPRSGEAGEGKLSQAFWEGGAWCMLLVGSGRKGALEGGGTCEKGRDGLLFFSLLKNRNVIRKATLFIFTKKIKIQHTVTHGDPVQIPMNEAFPEATATILTASQAGARTGTPVTS